MSDTGNRGQGPFAQRPDPTAPGSPFPFSTGPTSDTGPVCGACGAKRPGRPEPQARQRRSRLTKLSEIVTIISFLGILAAVGTFFGLDKKISSIDIGALSSTGKFFVDLHRSVQTFGSERGFWAMLLWALVPIAIAYFLSLAHADFSIGTAAALLGFVLLVVGFGWVFWYSVSFAGLILLVVGMLAAWIVGQVRA